MRYLVPVQPGFQCALAAFIAAIITIF